MRTSLFSILLACCAACSPWPECAPAGAPQRISCGTASAPTASVTVSFFAKEADYFVGEPSCTFIDEGDGGGRFEVDEALCHRKEDMLDRVDFIEVACTLPSEGAWRVSAENPTLGTQNLRVERTDAGYVCGAP